MESILIVDKIRKSYQLNSKKINVLLGASFHIARGEIIAIVGASGAGKSTLLHVIGGLDKPDDGAVFYDNESIYKMRQGRLSYLRAKHIGFIFQSYNLFPEMIVFENVMLPIMALPHSKSDSEIKNEVVALLSSVGMKERMAHKPMELSGGEQQRVAIARALMNDPDIILADEPTGNLDSATGKVVLDYLFKLVREKSRALVIVTHNDAVAKLCDKVLHLKDGVINKL